MTEPAPADGLTPLAAKEKIPLASRAPDGPNSRLRVSTAKPRRAVFVSAPQTRATLQEIGRAYGGFASGAIYVQPDPIGLEGGSLSLYTYVENNPLSNVDPKGLQALPIPVPPLPVAGGGGARSKRKADGFPEPANDSKFGNGDCPPDCREWLMALNRTYQALVVGDKIPALLPFNILKWQLFWASVKRYEQECGPWSPPPTDLDDIYGH